MKTTKPIRLSRKMRKLPGRRFIEFPEVKGKIAEKVRFFTAGDFHSVTLEFQDQTALLLQIEPGFTLFSQFQDVKTGNVKVLKERPPVRSAGLRVQ